MGKRVSLIIILILSCSFFLCPALVFAKFSLFEDVIYARHGDVPDSDLFLKGDIYLPSTEGPHPAIMLMHGGAWQLGDENFYADDWGPYLAERGYVVFSIQYRLSKPGGAYPAWPGCLFDCKAALQFLRGKAAEYKVDPDRIAVGGDSAGGQLAALLALTQDWPAFANKYPDDPFADVSTRVKAVVSAYGAFSMENWWKWTKNPEFDWAPFEMTTFAEDLFGGTPRDLPAAYFEASPINYVRCSAKALGIVALPNEGIKIPWFITWGTEDPDVPAGGQSVPFVKALKEAGAEVTAVPVPGAGHYWFNLGKITGRSGLPDCEFDYKKLELVCKGATPNDFIAPELIRFLKENL
ncbi:alpha/beta hydrolase [Desulfospira joergensenii]|uniref:alpha/beta hydrolase n=1 Tax=Desulfospira joergensenii TaxID=53329 RepID=UPI0003B7B5D9|nr:alpha/beta hydrolase [Desulfospira joergensenii]